MAKSARVFGPEASGPVKSVADIQPRSFSWRQDGKVAVISFNRPERKNPLTFESYAELRDTFRALNYVDEVKTVVITGEGGNFCSGDVHDIIGPLLELDMTGLMNFTRMTGDLVKSIRNCPQTVIAAIDGVCAGAGACVAMASDLRLGTPESKVAFLFVRVGLSGADMGACAMLPRIIGQGRAAELLYTGRSMGGEEAERWGFYNRLVASGDLMAEAEKLAHSLADGPTFTSPNERDSRDSIGAESLWTTVQSAAAPIGAEHAPDPFRSYLWAVERKRLRAFSTFRFDPWHASRLG